jgi:ElaB/YqjD/DUF883 family membrane-anchored ribosome-binding protein
MKDNSKTAHTPKQILDDLHALVEEAEKMLGGLPAEHPHDAVGTLRARFDVAQERLAEIYSGARKKVISTAKLTDETIRENPYQSAAVAAGVGLLIGLLIGRRSK